MPCQHVAQLPRPFRLTFRRSDIKLKEEEARHARLEDRARIVEESRRLYEDRVKKEEDEITAREQEVGLNCRSRFAVHSSHVLLSRGMP